MFGYHTLGEIRDGAKETSKAAPLQKSCAPLRFSPALAMHVLEKTTYQATHEVLGYEALI